MRRNSSGRLRSFGFGAGWEWSDMGISTHILDTARGQPAREVPVSLARYDGAEWRSLNSDTTDADGRCRQLLPLEVKLELGLYRVRFETAVYYGAQRVSGLYPYVE